MKPALITLGAVKCEATQTGGEESDDGLLRRFVRDGDRDAIGVLFARHGGLAFRLALRICGNSADAEDAVQSAFIQILQSAAKCRSLNVRSWMMGFVTNACRHVQRERARRTTRENRIAAESKPDAEFNPDSAALRDAVWRAVGELPDIQRAAIWLIYREGMTPADAAESLQVPDGTVRSHVSRGLERLRALLRISVTPVLVGEALGRLPLESMPPTLAAALNNLAITAAVHGAGIAGAAAGAGGAGGAGAKAASMATVMKVLAVAGVAAALMAAGTLPVRVSVPFKAPASAAPRQTSADGAPQPNASPAEQAHAGLAAQLKKKVSATLHHVRFSDALYRLNSSVIYAYPQGLNSIYLDLECKHEALESVLTRMAAVEGLTLELRKDRILFWKTADDKRLAELARNAAAADMQARCVACHELAQLADRRVYPLLFKALSDPDEAVRIQATGDLLRFHLDTIGYAGNTDAALDALMKSLPAEKSIPNRCAVLHFIGALRNPRSLEPLIALTTDADPVTRFGAVRALENQDDARATAAIVKCASDEDSSVREAVIAALTARCDPRAIDTLLAASRTTGDAYSAAEGLARIAAPRAHDAVIAILEKGSDDAFAGAAFGLRDSDDPRVVELLAANLSRTRKISGWSGSTGDYVAIEMAKMTQGFACQRLFEEALNGSDELRLSAAQALAHVHDARAIDLLKILALSPDAKIRSRAAVTAYGVAEFAGDLLPRLAHDENADVRKNAVRGLGAAGTAGCYSELQQIVKNGDVACRLNAAMALTDRDDADAAGLLAKLMSALNIEELSALGQQLSSSALHHPAWADVWTVFARTRDFDFYSMPAISNPAIARGMFSLLRDADPLVRARTLYALRYCHVPEVLRAVVPSAADPDTRVRRCAAFALVQFDDSSAFEALRKLAADNNAAVPEAVCIAIESSPPELARALRLALLAERKPELLNLPVKHLCDNREPTAVPALIKLLNDVDPAVRAATANGVVMSYDLGASRIPLYRLRTAGARRLYMDTHTDFGALRDPRLIAALFDRLSDADAAVRSASANALAGSRNQHMIDVAASLLRGPDPALQKSAASILAVSHDLSVIGPLLKLFEADDASVREHAASVLPWFAPQQPKIMEAVAAYRQAHPAASVPPPPAPSPPRTGDF